MSACLDDLLGCFHLVKQLLGQRNQDGGAPFAVVRIVDNGAAEDQRIRNSDLFATDEAQLGGAQLHILDLASVGSCVDDIADEERALDQNVETGNQVF